MRLPKMNAQSSLEPSTQQYIANASVKIGTSFQSKMLRREETISMMMMGLNYLFKTEIEEAIRKQVENLGVVQKLQQTSKDQTKQLLKNYPRTKVKKVEEAKKLVNLMGRNSERTKFAPWAGNYTNWSLLSGQRRTVTGKVYLELDSAYDIGLDIQNPKVIGVMFDLAAQVFTIIDDYSSPSQYLRN